MVLVTGRDQLVLDPIVEQLIGRRCPSPIRWYEHMKPRSLVSVSERIGDDHLPVWKYGRKLLGFQRAILEIHPKMIDV